MWNPSFILSPAELDQAIDNAKYMLKCVYEVVAPVLIVWTIVFILAITLL